MGLDVSHLQLTLTPNDEGNFFTVKDWDLDCNVSIKHYSKYITEIDDLIFRKTIAIIETKKQYEELKKTEWFSEIEYVKVLIGKLDSLMQVHLKYIVDKEKLNNLETIHLGCEHDGIRYQTISFGEPIKVQGVYYVDDVGYQRKGMNRLFYDTFKPYMLWGKKEDFDLAYSCIGDEWYIEHFGQDKVNEMKKNFKENFIDKFEFGKSLLYASF